MTPISSNRIQLFRIFAWLLLALILSVLAVAVDGQELPAAPKAKPDRLELSLLLADAGSRSLDVYSTHRALDRGGRERMMPALIAQHPGAMGALEAGDLAGQWWVARKLSARHPKLAHLAAAIDFTADFPEAIHNLYIKKPGTERKAP